MDDRPEGARGQAWKLDFEWDQRRKYSNILTLLSLIFVIP